MKVYRFAGAFALLVVAIGVSFLLGERGSAQERGGAAYAFLEGKKVELDLRPVGLPVTDKPGANQDAIYIFGTVLAVDQVGINLKSHMLGYANAADKELEEHLFVPWTAIATASVDEGTKKKRR